MLVCPLSCAKEPGQPSYAQRAHSMRLFVWVCTLAGNVECARELVSHLGADTGSQERYMPLHVAVGTRNLQLVQLILSTEQVRTT